MRVVAAGFGPDLGEDLLQQVLGVGGVPDHAVDQPQRPGRVPIVELGEAVQVALGHPRQQVLVGAAGGRGGHGRWMAARPAGGGETAAAGIVHRPALAVRAVGHSSGGVLQLRIRARRAACPIRGVRSRAVRGSLRSRNSRSGIRAVILDVAAADSARSARPRQPCPTQSIRPENPMHPRFLMLLGGAAAAVGLIGALTLAADHREAPLIQEDPIADINDVYVFPNPNDPEFLVLVMTVNPFIERDQNEGSHFSPNVRYTFYVDNTGDAVPDEFAAFTFSNRVPTGGLQTFTVNLPGNIGDVTGPVTPPTVEPTPNPPLITHGPGGSRFFCGPRDDPFFFDLVGFNRTLDGTGTFSGNDGFDGFNVSAIVAELPLAALMGNGPGTLQIWGETARRKVTVVRSDEGQLVKTGGDFEQIERMGNPAISTALIPLNLKDLFNIGEPADDAADFAGTIVASLTALGTSQANIDILAGVAVPDTIKYDPSVPVGYPNGRALADDVIDTLFFFIFNQTGVTDLVGANDKSFLSTFPYLAEPHQPL
ncbi:MAG: DUF4331 domain-containing protein [Planctomycetota bacterium]|nr:MAG: DUF4331 domain-containing protein [Planctomycetota bacterium]